MTTTRRTAPCETCKSTTWQEKFTQFWCTQKTVPPPDERAEHEHEYERQDERRCGETKNARRVRTIWLGTKSKRDAACGKGKGRYKSSESMWERHVCVCRLYVCLCVSVCVWHLVYKEYALCIWKFWKFITHLCVLRCSFFFPLSLSLFLWLVCFACSLYKSQLFIIFVVLVYCTFSFAFAFVSLA